MTDPLNRERIEMRVMSVGCSDSDARWLLDRIAELEEALASSERRTTAWVAAREALEYYAKRNHYDDDILNDDGAVARAALLRVRSLERKRAPREGRPQPTEEEQ